MGWRHAQQQPDVAGDDLRGKSQVVLAVLDALPSSSRRRAGRGPIGHTLGGFRGWRKIAEHVPDQAHRRLGCASGPHRPARVRTAPTEWVADVSENRSPGGLQGRSMHRHCRGREASGALRRSDR
jgi:hypothetical protein